MTDFLESVTQIEELLRLWKATLLTEEAVQKTLPPVPPNVAQIEGRNYFKYPLLNSDNKLSDFLLGNTSQLSITIQKEQIPFLKYLKDQDRLSKKFRQPIEHDFIIGFPSLYYLDRQGKEKLTTLFKFPLCELLYPTLPDRIDQLDFAQETPVLPSLEIKQELGEDGDAREQFWLDEFFIEEELGIPDETILDFRKIVRKEKLRPKEFLLQFCKTVLGEEKEYEEDRCKDLYEFLLLSIHRLIHEQVQLLQVRKKIQVYPFALIYELENIQPTRQLQNDLDDILSQGLMKKVGKKHPSRYFLFGKNSENRFAQRSTAQYTPVQLTGSQESSIDAVKGRKFTTIKGPPGTGKTHIIRNLLADRFVRSVQQLENSDDYMSDLRWISLITSSNNRAVDNALEGMDSTPHLPIHLRVGSRIILSNTTVHSLQEYALQLGNKEGHEHIRAFYQGKKELDELIAKIKKEVTGATGLADLRYKIYLQARKTLDSWVVCNKNRLLNIIGSLIDDIEGKRGLRTIKKPSNLRMLLTAFPIVGCTLLSLRNFFPMEENSLGLVIIDEAGQCVPSYLLPALVRSKKAVLIGDTKQLEPVVRLRESEIELIRSKRGIPLDRGKTTFFSSCMENPRSAQHIAQDACENVLTLKDHFRCHQSIIKVSMELCNYDLIVHTQSDEDYKALQYMDVTSAESRYGSSWANLLEVEKTVLLIQHLFNQGVRPEDIAVLTPYRGQLNHINYALRKKRIPFNSSESSSGKAGMTTTGTVHRFQGGERLYVIFSHVITTGTPLFLNSRVNLLNVALSRAQKSFMLIGSLNAMSRGVYTNLLREHLLKSGQKLLI